MVRSVKRLLLILFFPSLGFASQIVTPISGTDAILNQNSLQSGATFYVSSGTVTNLNASQITYDDGTVQVSSPTTDHGGLGGLTDDDHTQYRLESADHSHQTSGLQGGQIDHGLAISGLTDDDHTQYLLLDGRSGGQDIVGGTGSGDDLTLESTSHATKGRVIIQSAIDLPETATASNITLDDSYFNVQVNATSGAKTITLPSAFGASGAMYFIAKSDVGTSSVTINAASGETIDGSSSIGLFLVRDGILIQSDGTLWMILADRRKAHSAKMTRNAAQSINNGTVTDIAFDNEDYDIGDIADSTTNDRFNIRRAGRYLITAMWTTPSVLDSGEQAWAGISINNAETEWNQAMSAGANLRGGCIISNIFNLSVGDTIEMMVFHNEGSSFNTETDGRYKPKMAVTELR